MKRLPFDVSALPEPMRDLLADAVEEEWYEEAIEALEELAADAGTRTPAVLLSLAHCLHEDALTCLVDDVEAFSDRSLHLIEEAIQKGADHKPISSWRARIETSRRRARQHRERIESLFDAPIETLSRDDLLDVARALPNETKWTDKKLTLYRLIEQLERDKRARGEPGNPEWYRACQGSALSQAQRWDEARPFWDEILASPDSFDAFWVLDAHSGRLMEAIHRRDPTAFLARWSEALAARDEATQAVGAPSGMPRSAADQETALTFALELGLVEPARELVAMIRDRKKREIDAQTRSLLERADALLARAVATSGCLDS